MLVVDASVAVKSFLVEPGDREALALLDGDGCRGRQCRLEAADQRRH
jgi:hypothetical protein